MSRQPNVRSEGVYNSVSGVYLTNEASTPGSRQYFTSVHDSPYGIWESSERILDIGPYGPTGRANDPPSRTVYRGTDLQRAREYVATGNTAHIATAKPGDFHKHSSGQQAAYFISNEAYADQCAQKNPGTGAVIQQRVLSSLLDSGYHFPTEPSSDWRTTVLYNRAHQSTPRDPRAVAQSRQRDVTTGPIADVHTKGLLSATRKNPSGPAYADAFKPAIEPGSSTGASGIDEHRRGTEWAPQLRLQGLALQDVAGGARSLRLAKAPERRR